MNSPARAGSAYRRCPKCKETKATMAFTGTGADRGGNLCRPCTIPRVICCRTCHERKPASLFVAGQTCMPCQESRVRTCAKCKKAKPLAAFKPRGTNGGGSRYCIPCTPKSRPGKCKRCKAPMAVRANGAVTCDLCRAEGRERLARLVNTKRENDGENMRMCECGQPKEYGAEGCRRCMYLDGKTSAHGLLIAALRTLGGSATLAALQLETGCSHENVTRVATSLASIGRVRRVHVDSDEGPGISTIVEAVFDIGAMHASNRPSQSIVQ